MRNWGDYSFIIRSKHRKRVFIILSNPKIPTEIAKELDLNLGYISNIIISLLERRLIKCLNSEEKRHRLYIRTKKGEELVREIEELKDTSE